MTIEQTISKAIEGGWVGLSEGDGGKRSRFIGCLVLTPERWAEKYSTNLFLDKSFWESIGEVMGWNQGKLAVCERCGERKAINCLCIDANVIEEWLYHWHRFIDHLAEGKSAESFFASF